MVRPVRREIERKLNQLLSGESELYLITDGKTSQFEHESTRIIELLKNSRSPLALVSMSDMAKRLAEFEATARNRNPDDQPKQQLKLFQLRLRHTAFQGFLIVPC